MQAYIGKLVICSLSLVYISGCVTMERWAYCDSEKAHSLGYEDIQRGRTGLPSMQKGNVCEGDYSQKAFRRDFRLGAAKSFREICSKQAAATRGRSDGRNGYVKRPGMNRLEVCQSHPKYKSISRKAYKSAFTAEICKTSNIIKFGADQGDDMAKMDAQPYLQYCSNRNELYEEFSDAYRNAVMDQCSLSSMSRRGIKAANDDRDLSYGLSLVRVCPQSMQAEAIQSYRSSFVDQTSLIHERKKLEMAKQRIEQERLRLEAERQHIRHLKEREYSRQRDLINDRKRRSLLQAAQSSFGFNSLRYFKKEIKASCKVKNHIGVVKFKNRSNTNFDLPVGWDVHYFDRSGRSLRTNRKERGLRIGAREKVFKKDYSAPKRAQRCKVILYD